MARPSVDGIRSCVMPIIQSLLLPLCALGMAGLLREDERLIRRWGGGGTADDQTAFILAPDTPFLFFPSLNEYGSNRLGGVYWQCAVPMKMAML